MGMGWCGPQLEGTLGEPPDTTSKFWPPPLKLLPLASSSISGGVRPFFGVKDCYRLENSTETIAQEDPVAMLKAACIASAAT